MKPSHRFLNICEAVRTALEVKFPRRKSLRNCCSLASYTAAIIAAQAGIKADIMGGYFDPHPQPTIDRPVFGNHAHILLSKSKNKKVTAHAWLLHRRNYIDLTMTQFERDSPRVAILPVIDPRFTGQLEDMEFVEVLLGFIGWDKAEVQSVYESSLSILEKQ